MSFLASLAPGYPCPKSESKCDTELFLTLVSIRVHQHQKRSALYPQIHQSSWTVLLCSQSLWQMQQACRRYPTFFFSKVSGVLSVSSLRNCTCSLPAAQALWSVPVTGCSCLALHVITSVIGAQCLLLPQDIPAGLCSWELLCAGDFQTSFYQVRNMFLMSYWW